MDFDDIIRLGIYVVLPILFKFIFGKGKKVHEKEEEIKQVKTNKDIRPYLEEANKPLDIGKQESYTYSEEKVNYTTYEIDYMSERISRYDGASTIEKPKTSIEASQNTTIINSQINDQINDSIKDSEISSMDIELSFKKEDMIKGIIMSEVLSKPRAYQKR